MVGNPYRWKAVIPQLELRNGTAGCLLAVLFFVPLFAKTFHLSLGILALFIAIYVSVIVPIGTGIISKKYFIGKLRKLASVIFDEDKWKYYITQITYLASWLHFLYLQLEGIHIFTMQVLFNMAAEKLLCPEQRLSCLYVLLFYSVLAYLQRSLHTRPWAQLLNESSTTEFIKLTTAFIIVRLGKGVALSLVLLTFTLQFNHLEPSYTYVAITLFYFCLSQYQNYNLVKVVLTDWLSRLELQCLDGMEEFWVPIFTQGVSMGLSSVILIGLLLFTNNYIVMVMFGYANVFVPFTSTFSIAWKTLSEQKAVISKYPVATWKNPQIKNGNPCAICLDKMRILSARCTPCGHVFHGSCLRKCLFYSNQCPLCKHEL